MKTNRVCVLVIGSIMQLFLGILYVWSVFVTPVSEYFDWAESNVKLTSSFMLAFFVIGMLVGGKLQVKVKTQPLVLIGGLLVTLGMVMTAFLPINMGFLIYITYGIIGGFGVGLAYTCILSVAQKSFPDKSGIATGISLCTFGFATVLFTPLITYLIENFEVKNTFLILAAMFFIVTISGFSFIDMPKIEGKVIEFSGKQYNSSEIVKTKEFYYITFSLMFGIAAYFILNPSFYSIAQERNVSVSAATIMIMITGIANASGRLAFPMLSDKIGIVKTCLLVQILTASCSFLLTFVTGLPLIISVIIIAFCYGGISGTYTVLTGRVFGLQNVGANWSTIMIGFAVSSIMFPIILSGITSMMIKFIILGILSLIAFAFVLMLSKSDKI